MTNFEDEERLPPHERFRLYARRLQVWRLCYGAACRRARSCRGDPRRCDLRIADWVDEVRMAASRELNARDPERRAQIDDLKERIARLRDSMTEGA